MAKKVVSAVGSNQCGVVLFHKEGYDDPAIKRLFYQWCQRGSDVKEKHHHKWDHVKVYLRHVDFIKSNGVEEYTLEVSNLSGGHYRVDKLKRLVKGKWVVDMVYRSNV